MLANQSVMNTNDSKCSFDYYETLVSYDAIREYFVQCYPNDYHKYIGVLKDEKLKLPTSLYPILVIFVGLIIIGACGNFLVVYVVARNKAMRTPRNVFIVNLAISDFTLCVFTQPFNVLRIITFAIDGWPLGHFMCKFTSLFQGTNIFVSTISITAIALDRFQVIVHPSRANRRHTATAITLILIWIISFLIAGPLALFSGLIELKNRKNVQICTESVTSYEEKYKKIAYSLSSIVFQYLVPLVIVITSYTGICLRIKNRMVNSTQHSTPVSSAGVVSDIAKRKQAVEQQRQRRTNILLASIAIIFALSWLPLNICNITMDFLGSLEGSSSGRDTGSSDSSLIGSSTVLIIQAICLLLVLGSACCNPILYGWLNDNFRTEFRRVLHCSSWKCCSGEASVNDRPRVVVVRSDKERSADRLNSNFQRSEQGSQIDEVNPSESRVMIHSTHSLTVTYDSKLPNKSETQLSEIIDTRALLSNYKPDNNKVDSEDTDSDIWKPIDDIL